MLIVRVFRRVGFEVCSTKEINTWRNIVATLYGVYATLQLAVSVSSGVWMLVLNFTFDSAILIAMTINYYLINGFLCYEIIQQLLTGCIGYLKEC